MAKKITNEKEAIAAVRNSEDALESVPRALITAELCKVAIESHTSAFKYVPKTLMTAELWKIAVTRNGWVLEYVPDEFKTAELCNKAVEKSGGALGFVPKTLKTPELCEAAVKNWASALEFVPEEFKTQELCNIAVKVFFGALKFVPEAFKTRELCEAAIKINAHAFSNVPKTLMTPDFCLGAARINHHVIDFIPENLLTEEIQLVVKNKKRIIALRRKTLKGIKTKDHLLEALEKLNLKKYKEFIAKTVRPAVEIVKKKNASSFLACSHFGGLPDLPARTRWPEYNSIPYRFLGQINFADIPANDSLPHGGLLSIFVSDAQDDEHSIFYRDDGFVHAVYIPKLSNLETISPPPGFNIENPCEILVEFQPTVDIPFDEYQVKNWPFDDEEENEIYNEIRTSLKKDEHLLGYPAHNTLAYDPTPGPEWVSLLNLFSNRKLQWCWGDGDSLMIFIEKEKLKIFDFSYLKADAG